LTISIASRYASLSCLARRNSTTHTRNLNSSPQSFLLSSQRYCALEFKPPSRVKIASQARDQVAFSGDLNERIGHFYYRLSRKDGKVSGIPLVRSDGCAGLREWCGDGAGWWDVQWWWWVGGVLVVIVYMMCRSI